MRIVTLIALLALIGCSGSDETRTLTWTDNSKDEDGFKVYRIIGEKKTQIETTPPNTTTIKVTHLPGSCYAVTAFKGSEETTPTVAYDQKSESAR